MNIVKLIVTTVFLSISLSVYAVELQGLFGIEFNKNINNYVSKDYLRENKSKHIESKSGYFSVYMGDKTPNKNPYFDTYWVVVDSNNKVHEIYASKSTVSLEVCLSQIESLKDSFINKYQSSFEHSEQSFSDEISDYKTYINYFHTDSGDYLALQCHLSHSDNSVFSQAILRTRKLSEAVTDFYNSGI
jgi:hypothetical protein